MNLSEAVIIALKQKGLTISTAESCTAGRLASVLAENEGASKCLAGGVVSYTNNVKTEILGVLPEDIEKYDVVSGTVAEEMANGIRNLLHTDVGVGITGYIGQTGGNEKVSNGTVWIHVSNGNEFASKVYHVKSNSRVKRMEEVVLAALNLIVIFIESIK